MYDSTTGRANVTASAYDDAPGGGVAGGDEGFDGGGCPDGTDELPAPEGVATGAHTRA